MHTECQVYRQGPMAANRLNAAYPLSPSVEFFPSPQPSPEGLTFTHKLAGHGEGRWLG